MKTWRILRARMLDLSRGWLWKSTASIRAYSGINIVPITLLFLYLLLTYLFPVFRVSKGAISGKPFFLTNVQLKLVADIHLGFALSIGIFGGIVALIQFFLEEDHPWYAPVRDSSLTRSFLLVRIFEAVGVLFLFVYPGCFFMVRYLGLGVRALLGDVLSITAITACALLGAVSISAVLRLIVRRIGQRFFQITGILGLLLIVAFGNGLADRIGDAGPFNALVSAFASLGSLSRLLLIRGSDAPLGSELLIWWGGLLAIAPILLEIAVWLLHADHEDAPVTSWMAESSRWQTLPLGLVSPGLRPFVERDLILLSRQPLQAARQLLVVVVALVGLPLIFPKSDASVFMLTVLQVPPLLCATFILHSFGREGDFIHVIRLAASVDALYRARLVTSIVVVPLLSLLVYLAMTPLFLARFSADVAVLGGVFVVIESFGLVFCALATGMFFVDFQQKKLRPDYGVTIGGELAFWGGSGFISLNLFILTQAYLDQHTGIIAACLALLVLMSFVIRYFFVRGQSRLVIN